MLKNEIMNLSIKFKIAETENFKLKLSWDSFKIYYKKIKDFVYPQLKVNPYFWLNIKKLKWKYKNVYRYRIWKVRLFYVIKKEEVILIMTDIVLRKSAYC